MASQRRCAVLTAALLLATAARAQLIELEPSAALACLTPTEATRPTPEYPFAAYKAGLPGRVQVALQFTGADLAPEVEVVSQEGERGFVDAVKQSVKTYRVPCLPAGRPARLLFDFHFRPDDRKVYWKQPVDSADTERSRLLACAVQTQGAAGPEYPYSAIRRELQGRVHAKLRFVAPDKPPEFELYHRESAGPLAGAVREWLTHRRLPCLQAEPVEANATFVFKLEERAHGGKPDEYGFRPLTLLELLRATKGLDQMALSLDTRTMACPFDLKFTYLRPQLSNLVGQVAGYDPARAPLIDWLRSVELDLRKPALDSVFADTADLAVPCINLQLTPKEKTS